MAEAMRAKKVAICLYMVAIKVRKVDGMLVWTCAERGTAAKKQEQTKSENTHAKTRRSLRDREKIFKLSASPRGNSGFTNEKNMLLHVIRPFLVYLLLLSRQLSSRLFWRGYGVTSIVETC